MTTPDPLTPPQPTPSGPPTEPYAPAPDPFAPPPAATPAPATPAPAAPQPGTAAASASTPPGGPAPSQAFGRPPAQARPPQTGIVGGIILIVIGSAFLAGRVLDITLGPDAWPLWIIIPGLGMFVASFAIPPRGGLGLAIPGAIVTIVGAILWFQEANGLYETWAYAWALVAPTGPGLGMLAYGLVRGDRELAGDGLRTTLVGLGLFAGFALFFEGALGLSGGRIAGLDDALPVIVIGLGVLLVVLSLFGRRGEGQRA